MRRGMTNRLQIRVSGMDLSACSGLTLYIEQCGTLYTYTGTADANDTELMNVTVPLADAVNLVNMPAKFQVALTDSDGISRSHDPIIATIGDLLEESGYGS